MRRMIKKKTKRESEVKEVDLTNNSLELNKGNIREGMLLFAWDGIQECTMEDCPVINKCEFSKEGKCSVHVNYIRTLTDTIKKSYKYLDEIQYFKIGMQIIPLYSHLLRMKLLEMGIRDICFTSKKGIFIHPVYREIRQTLTTIHLMWKDLEIQPVVINPSLCSSSETDSSSPEDEEMFLNGDKGYYDRISKTEEHAEGKIR